MKHITYNEKTKVFKLHTKNSVYQMQVRDYDTLAHLYYGSDMRHTALSVWTGGFPAIRMKQGMTVRFLWMCCHRNILDMETGITGSMRSR